MKGIMKLAAMISLTIVTICACKKNDMVLDLDFSPVEKLATPTDEVNLKLDPTSSATVLFKWDPASAADGGLILYELAFDKENGDFSKPIFKVISDGSGVYPQVSLTHKDLNKIANSAGIASSSTGKMKWTVISSKGTNFKTASVSARITVERPAGFAESPTDLYLSGTATEGGPALAQAIKLKKTEEGVFELYTSLKAGNYSLSDKNVAGGKTYYIDNGVIKEGSSGTEVTGSTKVFKLKLDFSTAVATTIEVQSVGLYMSAYGNEIGILNYIGNSTFQAPRVPVEFFQFSWGRDERYKFIVHTAAGPEFLGSSSKDNGSPVGKPASYFYLIPVSDSQWDNTYKFDPSADKKEVKVDVFLQPEFYTHKITVL